MRNGLFARLAVINIRKNKRTYIPYIFSCVFSIAMLYMMLFINQNKGINTVPHSADVRMITSMGISVIGIFSFIFLLYSNSFLMKRRQKELGLYNILGLEKAHIGKMLFLETLISSVVSFAGGIGFGILGSKLALLLLLKLMHVPAQFGFEVPVEALAICGAFYGVVFFLILLNNIRRVHFTQPIELLRGSNVGEREPKAKWLIALIGFICLGSGYYIAVTTESPLTAVMLFFVAVLLVMAGTYLVFTAGSIAVLKMMRWNKSFYYKTKNFTSISGMLYRMKQNAVGLASICILSTGVLLMISTSVCLNSGMEDIIKSRYPKEVSLDFRALTGEEPKQVRTKLQEEIKRQNIPCENLESVISMSTTCMADGSEITFEKPEGVAEIKATYLTLISAEEYEYQTGKKAGISDGELLAVQPGKRTDKELKIQGDVYQVKEWLTDFSYDNESNGVIDNFTVIVTEEDFQKIFRQQKEVYENMASGISLSFYFDVPGGAQEERTYGQQVIDYANTFFDDGTVSEKAYVYTGIRADEFESFQGFTGGLLFIGLFLGALFLMGAAMIIYYKQISEGYEDKERFEIMQKVGMSKKEVKSSIRRQIIMVFFAPLLMASLHIAMAFPMVKRLLALFAMDNSRLFAACTIITICVFAAVYGVIYGVTARIYYKIVERGE